MIRGEREPRLFGSSILVSAVARVLRKETEKALRSFIIAFAFRGHGLFSASPRIALRVARFNTNILVVVIVGVKNRKIFHRELASRVFRTLVCLGIYADRKRA